MNVQEFGDQKDALRIATSNGTVEGDSNDNHVGAEASVIQVESQAEAMEVGVGESGDDVPEKAQKDSSESIDHSGEVKESQPCNLKADPSESHDIDISFGDKQHVESSDGLGGNAGCASQPTEMQKVSLEDKSVAGSDEQPESEILATILDESRSYKGDNAGENVFQDNKTKLLPEPKEIQDATEVEPGICRTEDSGEENVCGSISKETKITSPVLSVNDDSISEGKDGYHHIDDCEKPFELDPLIGVVKPETEHAAEETSKLLPEPDKNQDAVTLVCENGPFDVAHGLVSEEPGTQIVGDPSVQIQKSYQHVDNSEKPFDLHLPSGISEAQIPAFIVPKAETDFGGENIAEDMRIKLLPESDENDGAIAKICENGHLEVDHGLSAEEPGAGSVNGPSVKENEDHSPVLSVSHSVPERNESNQHVDDSETSFEMHPSSSNSTTPIVASSCLKTDTDLGEGPGQCIKNAQHIDVSQGHEVDQEASSCKEVVGVKLIENLTPVNEDVDASSVESEHYVTEDTKSEIESFVPETPMTVTDQAAQIEDSADQAAQIEDSADQAAQIEDTSDQAAIIEDSADQAAQFEDTSDQAAIIEDSADQTAQIEDSERERTTSHGDDLDIKNEIVLDNAESNNVSPIVSNAEPDLKQEKSSSTCSRNMSSTDDSERPLDVHSSSSSSMPPIVVSSCMKPEIDIGEKPDQKIENSGHEVDQEASPCKEIVEDLRPDNDDIDTLAAESVENGHYITKHTNLEIKSCLPDTTTFTVINQAAKIEDSAGVDTNLSFPLGEAAGLEKKTTTSVKVDQNITCSDGHSPTVDIDGIEPILGITKPDREMATFHGECLDSKNETVLVNAGSNDITTEVSNEESVFKHENMPSSDDGVNSVEMDISSSNSDAPVVVSSFVKPEIELGERLGQSIENGPDIDVFQVDQEASSCKESVEVVFLEGLKPESEDTDALGVEGVENGHSITRDQKLEIKSCVPDTTITVIDKVAEIENPAGGETTTFNGAGLDSKNEIVHVSDKSNDIPTVVSNVKSENENLPNLHAGIGDSENKEEQLSGKDVDMSEKLDVEKSNFTSAEISDVDARNEQNVGSESLLRPFPFLIRMPKFDDTKIREQVRQAQLIVDEKTRLRDAFRLEIIKFRNNCRDHDSRYKAAIDESRASKRAVKSKRAEIDSLQTVINKVKNAQSIAEMDARIVNMEHMIEHETMPLSEEKQFIREIKQLKQRREQLSSSIGPQDEVQQALNDKDQFEGRLKGLRKELDGLKDSVLKAEAVARDVDKVYEAESKKLKEVQDQYTAADNVRQEAYRHMHNLKTEMYEKNQRFRLYKRDAAAAYDHAAKRETNALHNLCFNQVESVMEVWNNNAEFRKEYVMSNMRSTIRRLGTFDGRSLGPDEKPQFVSNLDRPRNPPYDPSAETLQKEGQDKHIVEAVALSKVDSNSNKVKEEEEAALKSLEAKKTMNNQGKFHLGNGVEKAVVSASGGVNMNDIKAEEPLPNKEELELARKAEEKRKEQCRLEEKAKAMEALERKKKIAEKAQSRAELRAQKEAEQREKEREKKLRKKERKKGTGVEAAPDVDNLGDNYNTIPKSDRWIESIKEPEIKEISASSSTGGKRSKKPVQYTKQSKNKSSIPPPLRNKGRKKLHQWILWGILTLCLVVFLVFFVINLKWPSSV